MEQRPERTYFDRVLVDIFHRLNLQRPRGETASIPIAFSEIEAYLNTHGYRDDSVREMITDVMTIVDFEWREYGVNIMNDEKEEDEEDE